MNDAQLWLMTRSLESELRDKRLARSARLGPAPKRAPRLAALLGRRPRAAMVEMAPARLREA